MPPRMPSKNPRAKSQKQSPAELIKKQLEQKAKQLEQARLEAQSLQERINRELQKQSIAQRDEEIEVQVQQSVVSVSTKCRYKFVGDWQALNKNNIQTPLNSASETSEPETDHNLIDLNKNQAISTLQKGNNEKLLVESPKPQKRVENLRFNVESKQKIQNTQYSTADSLLKDEDDPNIISIENSAENTNNTNFGSVYENLSSEIKAFQSDKADKNIKDNFVHSNGIKKSLVNQPRYRSPVLCILGHVDTGKTKILDFLRKTAVQSSEAGGITQQIGATFFPMSYLKNHYGIDSIYPGLLIIDTPGHESFNNLRQRGSNICNVCVLVVDIFHGLENQTLESLELVRSRKIPFIIALNKIDRLVDFQSQNKSQHADSKNTGTAESDKNGRKELNRTKTGAKNKPTNQKSDNKNNKNAKNSKNTNNQSIGGLRYNSRNLQLFFDIKKQSASTQNHFHERLSDIQLRLNEVGLNTSLFCSNPDYKNYVSIVPTSAITGDGIPDLLQEINFLCSKMSTKLSNHFFIYFNSKRDNHQYTSNEQEIIGDIQSSAVERSKIDYVTNADIPNIDGNMNLDDYNEEKISNMKTKNKDENDLILDKLTLSQRHNRNSTNTLKSDIEIDAFFKKVLSFDKIQKSIYLKIHPDEISLFHPSFECTVLETKVLEGFGTTIDCILSQGNLNENDRLLISTSDGIVSTNVRSILTNDPCKESRVKGALRNLKEAFGCCGIKVVGHGLEKALPGCTMVKIIPEIQKIEHNLFQIQEILDPNQEINLKNLERARSSGFNKINNEEPNLSQYNKKIQIPDQDYALNSVNIENIPNNVQDTLNPIFKEFHPDLQDTLITLFQTGPSNLTGFIQTLLNSDFKVFVNISNKPYQFKKPESHKMKNIAKSEEIGSEIIFSEKNTILQAANLSEKGCHVQASTLGSLEALLSYLKIPIASIEIGPLRNRDIKIAASNTDKLILAFDIPVTKEILEVSKEMGVKIIQANIIYHLLEDYHKFKNDELTKSRSSVTTMFPSILKLVKNSVFTKRSPLVLGVEVRGILRIGTEIISMAPQSIPNIVTPNNIQNSEKHILGVVVGIENNGKALEKAVTGDKVAIKIETKDIPRVYKKHFDDHSILLSNIKRIDIDQLKELYKDELSKDDWKVVIELKQYLHII